MGMIAVAIIGYALVSKRLATTVVTAPIFFAGIGLLVGPVLGLLETEESAEIPTLLLEAALVMVLFADASSLDVRRWTREAGLAGRLLGLGLPLTMLAGAFAALLLVPGLEIWQAALIGVILAPTDAALGQAVVSNLRVPAVIRNALNVESGLNDGLALPFVTIFITVGLVANGTDTELNAVQTLTLALVGSTVVGAGDRHRRGMAPSTSRRAGPGPAALAAGRPRGARGRDVYRGRRDRGERVPRGLGRGARGRRWSSGEAVSTRRSSCPRSWRTCWEQSASCSWGRA